VNELEGLLDSGLRLQGDAECVVLPGDLKHNLRPDQQQSRLEWEVEMERYHSSKSVDLKNVKAQAYHGRQLKILEELELRKLTSCFVILEEECVGVEILNMDKREAC